MSDEKPAVPKTTAELAEAIDKLIQGVHDASGQTLEDIYKAGLAGEMSQGYVQTVEAMRDAAYIAFSYVANTLGATGFQASMADLSFIGWTRNIEGPFRLVDYSMALYPQYDLGEEVRQGLQEPTTLRWLKGEAQKNLDGITDQSLVSPAVLEHWKAVAALEVPADE